MFKKSLLVLSIFFLSLFFLSRESLALTVSPPILEFKVLPGQTVEAKIRLFNETNQTLYLKPAWQKFVSKTNKGQPELQPLEVADQFPNWFKIPAAVVLIAGELQEIPLTLAVPSTAVAGSYFPALLWQASYQPLPASSVSVTIQLGQLIFLEVTGGERQEVLSLKDFRLAKPQKLYFNLPIDFKVLVENQGNVYLQPKGLIKIKSFYGSAKANLAVNPQQGRILPQSEREFIPVWFGQKIALGRYTAELELFYGQENKVVRDRVTFWLFTWPAVVLLLGVILVLVIILRKLRA